MYMPGPGKYSAYAGLKITFTFDFLSIFISPVHVSIREELALVVEEFSFVVRELFPFCDFILSDVLISSSVTSEEQAVLIKHKAEKISNK